MDNYPGMAIPKPGIRKPKAMKSSISEASIQELAEGYLRLIGVEYFHLPQQILNAAFHARQMSGGELWAARNASAAIKGFPDLICFYKGFYRAIELKKIGGKLRQSQEHWLKRLNGITCYSFEEFKAEVDKWKSFCDMTRVFKSGEWAVSSFEMIPVEKRK